MTFHPVYRSLNKQMTLLGVERRLFFLILIGAFVLFQFSTSVFPAVVLFAILLVLARTAGQTDPQILRILRDSNKFATRYDPCRWSDGEDHG